MLKELEAYLRSDWWTVEDACQIFAGFVPIPKTVDNDGLSKLLNISSCEVCPKSNARDSETQVVGNGIVVSIGMERLEEWNLK